jgi:hypothetical protein
LASAQTPSSSHLSCGTRDPIVNGANHLFACFRNDPCDGWFPNVKKMAKLGL